MFGWVWERWREDEEQRWAWKVAAGATDSTEFLGEDSCSYLGAWREPSILSTSVTARAVCLEVSSDGARRETSIYRQCHLPPLVHIRTGSRLKSRPLVCSCGKEGFRLLVSGKPKVSHVRALCHHPDWVRVLERISLDSFAQDCWGILSEVTMDVSCVNFLQTKEQ